MVEELKELRYNYNTDVKLIAKGLQITLINNNILLVRYIIINRQNRPTHY